MYAVVFRAGALACAALVGVGCHGVEPFGPPGGEPAAVSARGSGTRARSALTEAGNDAASLDEGAPSPFFASRSELLARWNAVRGDGYELDAIDRFVEPSSSRRVRCAPEDMVIYRGEAVRYRSPVTVNPAFRERLRRFESVVAEVAAEVYGRAPHRIRHYGAYNCRTSRNRAHRLSEHALGNAIDVVGFDFGAATKKDASYATQPKRLRGPFTVSVARHWGKTGDPVAEAHARFLRTLTDRLLERRDVFRGFVGPGHPGHDDHLHFDVAPWRYVRL